MRKKAADEKSKRIAFHEAGHVVMNLLLGLPFEAVSVEYSQENVYEVNNGQKTPVVQIFTKGVTWSEKRTKSVNKNILAGVLDLREALSSMAGPQAEAMIVNKIDEDTLLGAQNDIQSIAACCRAAVAPDEPIENWKSTIMESQILQAVALQALEILNQNWASVDAVANALLERKSLTYSEAKTLIKKTT